MAQPRTRAEILANFLRTAAPPPPPTTGVTHTTHGPVNPQGTTTCLVSNLSARYPSDALATVDRFDVTRSTGTQETLALYATVSAQAVCDFILHLCVRYDRHSENDQAQIQLQCNFAAQLRELL